MIIVILSVLTMGFLMISLLLGVLIWLSGMRKATTGKGGFLWNIASFFENIYYIFEIFK